MATDRELQNQVAMEPPARAACRVLLFSNGFVMGGMERHIIGFASHLRARGAQVDLIYGVASQEALQPMLDALQECGATVHGLARHRGLYGRLQRFWNLYTLTRRISPDVIHMHFTSPQRGELPLLAFKAARPVRCRLIRTDHNPPESSPSWLELARLHIRDSLLDRIILVSRQNRDMHVKLLHRNIRKVSVVHNGIDTGTGATRSREEIRAEWSLPPTALIVGMVARLDEYRKGGDVFIRSIARARSTCPDLHFVVVGDGAQRPALEELAADLGIMRYGRFLGHRTDVADQLAGMDIFVLPSRYEGLPYSLLEALRSGVPAVATRVGGADEVIQDESSCGILVPPDDAEACAAAVVHLAQNPALRAHLSEAGPRRIAQAFSLDSMVAEILRVYRVPVSSMSRLDGEHAHCFSVARDR